MNNFIEIYLDEDTLIPQYVYTGAQDKLFRIKQRENQQIMFGTKIEFVEKELSELTFFEKIRSWLFLTSFTKRKESPFTTTMGEKGYIEATNKSDQVRLVYVGYTKEVKMWVVTHSIGNIQII